MVYWVSILVRVIFVKEILMIHILTLISGNKVFRDKVGGALNNTVVAIGQNISEINIFLLRFYFFLLQFRDF